ncbi:MAG: hypothetical protein CMJ79_08375 [Planctomycetaceae bacterium]|nr:hypothetical protein [Planctomycetaceae bacterium]
MNLETSFKRKVSYISGIVLLLFPLFYLGQPATSDTDGGRGGKLAQLRSENYLAQSNLGEIDPVSSTMQLATFGLRPIAVIVLWEKATRFQKMEDYDNVTATVNQISKLQPNFVSIWKFQAHNLAYNISVDFDNYRHRYQWVRRGIDFLMEGTQYNSQDAKLVQEVGAYTGSKIGGSDEKRQFRHLFAEDAPFHQRMENYGLEMDSQLVAGVDGKPDNWKVSNRWYQKSEDVAKFSDAGIRGDWLMFYERKPQALIYYAIALEDEGYLDSNAQQAFAVAYAGLEELGSLDILSTFTGTTLRLNQGMEFQSKLDQLRQDMNALGPNVRKELREQRFEALSKPEQDAMNLAPELRTEYHTRLVEEANQKMFISETDVAEAMPEDVKEAAAKIAAEAEEMAMKADAVHYMRSMINYDYWLKRCEMEQLDLAINARKTTAAADDLFVKARLQPARQEYEQAWTMWTEIFEKYPTMISKDTGQNLMPSIANYMELLSQFDEDIPEDFALQSLVELAENEMSVTPESKIQFPSPSNPDRRKGEVPKPEFLQDN